MSCSARRDRQSGGGVLNRNRGVHRAWGQAALTGGSFSLSSTCPLSVVCLTAYRLAVICLSIPIFTMLFTVLGSVVSGSRAGHSLSGAPLPQAGPGSPHTLLITLTLRGDSLGSSELYMDRLKTHTLRALSLLREDVGLFWGLQGA